MTLDLPAKPPTAAAAAASLDPSFRALLRHAVVGAVYVDLDGRFVTVNGRWCDMLGYTEEEMLGLDVAACTHPDFMAETVAAIAQVKAGLSGFVLEKRYLHKDGRTVWGLSNVTAVRDEQGRAIGMVALVMDITERKEAERRLAFLADLSHRLARITDERTILETAVEATGRFLGAHRCYFIECFEAEDRIEVSPTWCRDGDATLEGTYTLFEFGGREWWSRYAAGDFAVTDVETDPLTFERASQYLAYGVRSYAVQPFRSEGACTVVVAATDIVARAWQPGEIALLENVVARVWPLVQNARAQRALGRLREESERQRRFYETVLASSVDYISVIGRDRRFLYVNRRLAEFWGREPADFIGLTLRESGHTEAQVEQHERELRQVIATGEPLRAEIAAPPYHFEYIMAPIFAEDGSVEAVAGVTRDVTAQRSAEAGVRARSEEKDHFIAMLAHELRNPLAPLRTGLEVVRLAHDPARALGDLRPMMERQVNHLVRLVDDLLDMSRIGLNKIELRRSRVPLANVIVDAVEAARPAIEGAGHTLKVTLPEEALYLEADLTRIVQVLGNLLHNSCKFTRAGGRIEVVARRVDREAEILVKDNGIGIAPAELDKVFGLFSQAERPEHRAAGGLGIGLALVKGLVELHGGSVAAHSDGPGLGSTFTIRLPILPA